MNMKQLALSLLGALAIAGFTPASSHAMTGSDVVQLLGGNYNWYAAGDNDYNNEWSHYEAVGWDVVDFNNGALPPSGHDLTIWTWYKTRNGTMLWTKFRVRDPAASEDGWYHDWVAERTR